jgi:hypothetical protein
MFVTSPAAAPLIEMGEKHWSEPSTFYDVGLSMKRDVPLPVMLAQLGRDAAIASLSEPGAGLAELMNLSASRNRRDAGPEMKALGNALGQTQRLGCDLRRLRSRITATPCGTGRGSRGGHRHTVRPVGRRFACTSTGGVSAQAGAHARKSAACPYVTPSTTTVHTTAPKIRKRVPSFAIRTPL